MVLVFELFEQNLTSRRFIKTLFPPSQGWLTFSLLTHIVHKKHRKSYFRNTIPSRRSSSPTRSKRLTYQADETICMMKRPSRAHRVNLHYSAPNTPWLRPRPIVLFRPHAWPPLQRYAKYVRNAPHNIILQLLNFTQAKWRGTLWNCSVLPHCYFG